MKVRALVPWAPAGILAVGRFVLAALSAREPTVVTLEEDLASAIPAELLRHSTVGPRRRSFV